MKTTKAPDLRSQTVDQLTERAGPLGGGQAPVHRAPGLARAE